VSVRLVRAHCIRTTQSAVDRLRGRPHGRTTGRNTALRLRNPSSFGVRSPTRASTVLVDRRERRSRARPARSRAVEVGHGTMVAWWYGWPLG